MNNFESISQHINSSRLFPRSRSWPHEIVQKSLHDVDFSLAKSSVFVSSHAVGDIDGFERDVVFDAWVFYLDFVKTPFYE